MTWRPLVSWVGVGSVVLVLSGVVAAPVGASTAPISLLVPQSTAFAVLGHACGGIGEKAYGNGFDASTGYPTGDVYLSTTCSAGGRGGHSTTYAAWVSTMWDFTGGLVSYAKLASTPTVNPTFSQTDSHGNQLYNSSSHAYLALASGFVPAPRVSGVSPSSGPQGSTVTIGGTGFTGVSAVSFGSRAAVSYTVNSSTSITAVTPAVPTGTVDVKVTGSGGMSATTVSDRFTFVPVPRVAGLSPTQGTADGGTSVTISGVNFTGARTVSFGGVAAAFRVVSATSIVASSPAGPDSGVVVDVTVSSPAGTSALTSSDRYTYL
jgi:hypothetical protein